MQRKHTLHCASTFQYNTTSHNTQHNTPHHTHTQPLIQTSTYQAPTFGIKDSRSILEQRQSLPIYKLKDQLVQAVMDNQVGLSAQGLSPRVFRGVVCRLGLHVVFLSGVFCSRDHYSTTSDHVPTNARHTLTTPHTHTPTHTFTHNRCWW